MFNDSEICGSDLRETQTQKCTENIRSQSLKCCWLEAKDYAFKKKLNKSLSKLNGAHVFCFTHIAETMMRSNFCLTVI